MYCVELHKGINQIIKNLYRFGFWHLGDEPTGRETTLKLFYSIYYSLFPISLIWGGIVSDNRGELILLVASGIAHAVLCMKLFYLIWNKNEILELFDRISVYSVEDHEQFNRVNEKLNSLMKFVKVFISGIYLCVAIAALIVPFLGSEKKLFVNFAFPFDWKNNKIAYWMAYAFFLTEALICSIAVLFTIIMWYLLLNCSLQYDVLGHQIENIGATRQVESTENKHKISDEEKENLFQCDLVAAILSHQRIRKATDDTASFLSDVFLIKIATSALCICGSVYCLTTNTNVTFLEYLIYIYMLLYNFFDIFMVMYLGNEIKLSSNKLSYCLFQSTWIDRSQKNKKCLIICADIFKVPHELIFGKLYPLTLETFTRILHGAYSMFNILQNLR